MQVRFALLIQGQCLLGCLQCWNYYEALVSSTGVGHEMILLLSLSHHMKKLSNKFTLGLFEGAFFFFFKT